MIINLSRNENPLGCSKKALNALHHIPEQLVSTYPEAQYHPISHKLAKQHNVEPNQIFLSNGSDYIFALLLTIYANKAKSHILAHDYIFCTYALSALALKIPVRSVAINEDWQVNSNNIIQACTEQTSIAFLANPNNPTGGLLAAKEVKHILESISQNTLLVLDEAYMDYASSLYGFDSIEWLKEYPNLVITRSFSKFYGLAGLRVGYAVADPAIIQRLESRQLPFTVNQAALLAANAALDDEEFTQLSLKTNSQGKIQLSEGLRRLNINHLPSTGNFVTFDCQEDSTPLYNYLKKQNIIIRQPHAYDMKHHMRITIGTQEQNSRFLAALESWTLAK